jgi:hypothetical protein
MTPDEDAVDQQPAAAPRRRVPVLGLVCVCSLVVVGGAIGLPVLVKRSGPPARFCRDVGLFGPPASTPEAALSAWITAYPADQPPESEWHRTGSTFTNQTYGHKGGYGLASVTVYQGASNLRNLEGGTTPSDQWSVDGGCV